MSNWKSRLDGDSTGWLLEESNPHVRYFALRWLLDKAETDKDVAATRQAIAASPPARKMLVRQRPQGYWGSDARPHHGTRGQLMLCLWLGIPKNEAIRKAMDYRMNGCLLENGAYGMLYKARMMLLPCHGAELLNLMARYGYAADPRCRKLLGWLVKTQEADGVWTCPSKANRFPCMWATADVLRAMRELPSRLLTAEVKAARERAIELFLNSNLSQYGKKKAGPDWFHFGYPLHFTADILDVLESVAPFVSPTDERIREGLHLVLQKQDKKGRWVCEKHGNGSQWMQEYVTFDPIGEPSKWVTLHVYKMLKTLHSMD